MADQAKTDRLTKKKAAIEQRVGRLKADAARVQGKLEATQQLLAAIDHELAAAQA